MKIAVSAESTCDLSKDLIEKYDVKIIPYHVILGEEEYQDDGSLSSQELFEFVDKNGILPKTAALTVGEYEDYFKNILKDYDAVIHITLSSRITSSVGNCEMAAKNCQNVFVIDSKSLSTGFGLLVLSCAEKIKAGLEVKQIVNELLQEVERVQASFVVNTLKYLHKGGRCSAIALLGANLLKIKPKIALIDGKMEVVKKYMGKLDDVLVRYCNDLLNDNNPNLNRVFVTYSSRVAATDKIIQILKDYGFKEVYETQAGCTICSHCGRDTLGVLFLNREKDAIKG